MWRIRAACRESRGITCWRSSRPRIAAAAVDGARPPFDTSIFFEAGQSFRVYLMERPADGMIRFGGDFLLTVERKSDQRVLDRAAARCDVAGRSARCGTSNVPTAHSHLDSDLPTATDVALVMIWPTLAPHLVLTPRHIFRIDADGTIGYLGPNEPLDAGAGGVE